MLDGEGARVIEQAGAGLVCPSGDGRALADRVAQLAALPPAERAAMGARGVAYSQREFDRHRLLTLSRRVPRPTQHGRLLREPAFGD